MASQEQEVKNTYDYLPDTTASKVARDGQVGRIPFFCLIKLNGEYYYPRHQFNAEPILDKYLGLMECCDFYDFYAC